MPRFAGIPVTAPAAPTTATAVRPRFAGVPVEQPAPEPPSLIDRALDAVAPAARDAWNTVDDIGQVYPVVEAGANLATQAVAMPVAGLSGIGAAIGNLAGLTDAEPAQVVQDVGNALTYQPQTTRGQRFTGVAMQPFELLAEAGNAVGETVADAPVTANTVQSLVDLLPGVSEDSAAAAGRASAPALGAAANAALQVFAPIGAGRGIAAGGRALEARRSPVVDALPEANPVPPPIEPAAQPIVPTPVRPEPPRAVVPEPAQQPMPARRPPEDLPRPIEEIEAAPPPDAPAMPPGAKASPDALPPVETPRPQVDTLARGAADEAAGRPAGSGLRAGEDVLSTVEGGRPAQGWASATRVRRGGSPATLYRGESIDLSPEHFAPESLGYATRHPSASLGVWFSNSRRDAGGYGPKVSEHHVDIRRPKVYRVEDFPEFNSPQAAQAFRKKLEAAGFDGIVITARHLKGPTHVVAFRPGQVIRARAKPPAAETPKPRTDDAEPSQVESRGAPPQVNSFAPGGTYVGFINDNVPKPPSGGQGGAGAAASAGARPAGSGTVEKPIRREDVLRPFLKALNIPVYQGGVKGKGVMGWYRPRAETVRIKNKSDLETTAHEVAHHIDDRAFNGFRTDKSRPKSRPWETGPKAAVYAKELKGVSYDSNKAYEGFAEFVRLYMTQPDKARAAAPEFSKWFDDFVKTHEFGPAIRDAQAGMSAWWAQEPLARAASKIGEQKPLNDVMDTWRDELRQSVFDDLHGIAKMETEITGSTEGLGAYQTARLARAAYSIVDGALSLGAPKVKADGSHTFVGKGLEQILEPVARDLDNWTLYAVGRSAKELFQQGREKLFTANEIRAMLALETPEFRQAFADYQQWNKAVVDFAEAKGLINPQTRALWQRSEYLPFYRAGQNAATKRKGGVEGNWNGIQRLTGGTGNIRSVLGNMIQNASHLIAESLKNEARVKVADLADKVQGGGKFMTKIPRANKSVAIDREQIMRYVADMLGVKASDLAGGGGLKSYPPEWQPVIDQLVNQFSQEPGFIQFWMRGQAPKGDNIVAVMREGKPDFYEVGDPVLFRALQSLNRPGQNMVVRFLSWFRRIGQSSITLTPDFIAANVARDTILAGVMSRSGFRPIVDSIQGMKSRLLRDENYREFIANGGGLSSHLMDEQSFRGHLERFYSKRGINTQTVINTPTKLLYALETLADAAELSTRVGEYRRARQQGMSPREAAYQAREISTDFAMRGDNPTVGVLYDTVIFLKAAMNSMDRLYRGAAKDPQRAQIAAKTGMLALASMWLYSVNRDNPLYQDLEDWDKDTHWHFFVPKAGAADDAPPEERYHHFRYPKIWEIGAVSSLAERSLAAIMDDDKDGLGDDFARILGNLFHVQLIPQAVQPLYEQATNKDTFTGRPIETMGMESMAKWARAAPQTNRTLTELGVASRNLPEALQVNPVRTEALLRGYFNTWAMYGLALSDAALFDDKPTMRVDDYPVIRRFYAADPQRHTRYETEFYDMLRDATELRRTMKQMDKTGRPEIAGELQAEPLQGEYTFLSKMQTRLRAIYADQREVYRDNTLSPDEKRQRLDDLARERNELLKGVVQGVNERKSLEGIEP